MDNEDNYIIIVAGSTTRLQQEVNEKIKEGYFPLGGLSDAGYSLCQAMYKMKTTIEYSVRPPGVMDVMDAVNVMRKLEELEK